MRPSTKSLLLFLCALLSPLGARAMTSPSIVISPGYSTIATSSTLQYSATVSGLSNTSVIWEVNGIIGGNSTVGTISASGLYQAPAIAPASDLLIYAVASNKTTVAVVYVMVEATGPTITSISPSPIPVGTYRITVTGSGFQPGATVRNNSGNLATTYVNSTTLIATGYQGSTGSGAFQVMNPKTLWGPTFTAWYANSLSISPATVSMALGATQQFTSNGATSWRASAGTITSTGLFTAPSTMPSGATITITASGTTLSTTAIVTIVPPPGPVSPANPTVILGKTQQFTATGATSWAASAGSITSGGLYTAPATLPTNATVTITATGPGGSSATTLALIPPTGNVTPATATLAIGKTQQFTATGATGWSASQGSISSTGLYTTPATLPNNTAVTITATGPGGSATGSVKLTPAVLAVTPATASINLGQSLQFSSTGAIIWNATAGSISNTGYYTAPSSMPASATVTISVLSSNGSGTAVVTLVQPPPPTVTPTTATVKLGTSLQFASATGVNWAATAGTVSNTGYYTAPSTMPAGGSATITATNASGAASASITLVTGTPQTISPSTGSLGLGQTLQFTSAGATSWTASAGTVSSTGFYTAPSTMPSSSTVSVTASGPNGSATATISLTSTTATAISPTVVSLSLGGSQQFTSSSATSWSTSAGSVTSTGLYTAPSTMPAGGSATVTATGPNGSATASIMLVAPTTQTITPSLATVVVGKTLQFSSPGATSWTATSGTISSTGLYTAPAAVGTATINVTGTYGTAMATVTLVAAPSPGAVSITTDNPYYGWQVIPGASRRIHARVSNGTTNRVNWSYTTAGGATATITPAAAPNVAGAFVDVTVGATGSTCNNIGTATNPVFSSAATINLLATSADDPTKSVTVPINVCNPPVQVYISPFNVRLYSGQTVDLQSWVWGSANDNVTWTITQQPSGGNGKFTAPPAGGSATASRDAVFSATVAGNYTVTATSVANPSASASAILSVSSNPLPAYAATPNHTEPVDCSVDPTLTGITYDIGAGHKYSSLANAFLSIGSTTLNPGTTIRLFNTDTTGTNPTRYHEYLRIDGQGTQAQPIRIVGCADAAGNLPILDGANATAYSASDNSAATGIAGLYQIALHHNNGFAVYPTITAPSYVIIEGLAFRNAYQYSPTASSTPNYYYQPGSTTPTQWSPDSACIRPYEGSHLTVRGNDVQDCADGVLADFNGNNGWGGFFGDFDLQGNYFTNLGGNNYYDHMAYVQGIRQVIQGNTFDQLKAISQSGELKLRGVGEVVRYNFFNSSTNTRTIDFVEEQDSNMYMSFLGYYYTPSGSTSFHNASPTDGYTPDLIAAADEAWHKAYAYGNIINMGPNTPNSQAPIHFFGDQGQYVDVNTNPPVRVGDLFDYSNTVYSPGGNTLHLVDTMQNQDNQFRWEWPTLTLWNNAIYLGPINTVGYQAFQMSTLRSDIFNLGPNWLSSNWGTNDLTCANNSVNLCSGTGWPYQTETTQYMDGSNLPAHVSGLSNLITGGTTVPFSLTNFAPTSGGGLVGAGAALPASISNMPVRFQITAPSYALTPRTSPLTLGAHD